MKVETDRTVLESDFRRQKEIIYSSQFMAVRFKISKSRGLNRQNEGESRDSESTT